MRAKLVVLILFIAVTCVIAFNVFNLIEAYGSGPPYYSRTTNIDKWQDPLTILLVIDVLMVAIVMFYFFIFKKAKKHK